MITKESLKFCFENLGEDEIAIAMDSDKDYVLVELHTTNVGSYSTVEPYDYDDDIAQEAGDNGQLFIDKDDFLRLYEESEANNTYLEEYV